MDWDDDETWYTGAIREYSESTDAHLVVYDDGDQRHEELGNSSLQWEFVGVSAHRTPRQAASAASRVPVAASRPRPSRVRHSQRQSRALPVGCDCWRSGLYSYGSRRAGWRAGLREPPTGADA